MNTNKPMLDPVVLEIACGNPITRHLTVEHVVSMKRFKSSYFILKKIFDFIR